MSKKNKQLTDALEKRKKQITTLERQVNEAKRKEGQRKPPATNPIPKDRPKTAPSIDVVAARTSRPDQSFQERDSPDLPATEVVATNNHLLELVKTYQTR